MNDEIKEILDKLKKQHSIDIKLGKEIANDFAEYKLNYKDMTLLLDYITNLQEENERLIRGTTLLKNKLIDMTKAKEDYKSRNEKAIEYIENCLHNLEATNDSELKRCIETIHKYLLDILNGGDEELLEEVE